MISTKDGEKRERFKNLLFQLAEDQKLLRSKEKTNEIYKELEELYFASDASEEFRHYYADIFAVLSEIDNESSFGDINILGENIKMLRNNYCPQNFDAQSGKLIDISKQLNKIYDHISLDAARMSYYKTILLRSQDELQNVKVAMTNMEHTIDATKETISVMEENITKAEEMQKQYITILGIFAAIVLAFTGGIAFSTSVLQNIANASFYRVTFISVLLAFVLIHVIYILIRFILEINKKKEETIGYPSFLKSLNWICFFLVVLITICWFFDIGRFAEIVRSRMY